MENVNISLDMVNAAGVMDKKSVFCCKIYLTWILHFLS